MTAEVGRCPVRWRPKGVRPASCIAPYPDASDLYLAECEG